MYVDYPITCSANLERMPLYDILKLLWTLVDKKTVKLIQTFILDY